MGRNSVLTDDAWPTHEELKALGRDRLIELQNEAEGRLTNQANIYGPTYRPGRQAYLQRCLEKDIELIDEALLSLDGEEGAA